VRTLLRDLRGALSAALPVARDAQRAALGDVRLQPEGDAVYAVFEDTADRLLLRAVGDGMGRVVGTGFVIGDGSESSSEAQGRRYLPTCARITSGFRSCHRPHPCELIRILKYIAMKLRVDSLRASPLCIFSNTRVTIPDHERGKCRAMKSLRSAFIA
jgi:hypothetical protein